MCCCPKPNKNGQPGYSWDGKQTGVRSIDGPPIIEGDMVLCDEPGRCRPMINGKGAIDYHSHHFRVVGARWEFALLVQHGGGSERIALHSSDRIPELLGLLPDSDARYLFCHALYTMHRNAERAGRDTEAHRWRCAVADGRARKRRYPKRGHTKVWIEDGPRIHDVVS